MKLRDDVIPGFAHQATDCFYNNPYLLFNHRDVKETGAINFTANNRIRSHATLLYTFIAGMILSMVR